MVSTLKVTNIQIPNSDSDVISLDASTGNIAFNKPVTGTAMVKLLDVSDISSAATYAINNTYINSTYDRYLVQAFFKQKTAYEIMPSLVGSEMCIRDSVCILSYLNP